MAELSEKPWQQITKKKPNPGNQVSQNAKSFHMVKLKKKEKEMGDMTLAQINKYILENDGDEEMKWYHLSRAHLM